MEKRLFLAMALSLGIIVLWSKFAAKQYPVANKEVTIQKTIENATNLSVAPGPTAAEVAESLPIIKATPLILQTDNIEAVFIVEQAALQEVVFKKYKQHKFVLGQGLGLKLNNLVFTKTNQTAATITFTHEDKAKKISKEFIFSNSEYVFELQVRVKNLSNLPLPVSLPLLLGQLNLADKQAQSYHDIVIESGEQPQHLNGQKSKIVPAAKFAGIKERYFCLIAEPQPGQSGYTALVERNSFSTDVVLQSEEDCSCRRFISDKVSYLFGATGLAYFNQA
jgi:hypothetical protein